MQDLHSRRLVLFDRRQWLRFSVVRSAKSRHLCRAEEIHPNLSILTVPPQRIQRYQRHPRRRRGSENGSTHSHRRWIKQAAISKSLLINICTASKRRKPCTYEESTHSVEATAGYKRHVGELRRAQHRLQCESPRHTITYKHRYNNECDTNYSFECTNSRVAASNVQCSATSSSASSSSTSSETIRCSAASDQTTSICSFSGSAAASMQ
mmetsp:Transcript_4494/g.7686  ORF Transcript_4494/g.7686 Transcript_4494/m.7686 type:complete len:209 (-) Transcript_4494:331-957(-)